MNGNRSERPLKILHLEDSPHDAELIRERLVDADFSVELDWACDEKEFRAFLERGGYDVILADYRLSRFEAPEALKLSKAFLPDVPFIAVTGAVGEETAVELLKQGATDYVLKDRPDRLPLAIRRALNEAKESRARREAEESLIRLNRQLRALSTCNQILIHAEDEVALLRDICRIICTEAGYRMAWVGYALDDALKSVAPMAWKGEEEGFLDDPQVSWADTERGRGPTGTAIRTGETIVVQDFTTDPRMLPWREDALSRGYRSGIALPLKDAKAGTFGALSIYSGAFQAFTPPEVRLLEELAGDLSFGILSLRTSAEHRQLEEDKAKLQAQLQQSQKMESLGRLAGGIAHDMNNVLGAILGMASAQISQHPRESSTYKAFDTISKAASRGGEMVSRLLSFARQKPVEERDLDVNALLTEAVALLPGASLLRTQIKLELAHDLWTIRGDPNSLSNAIMNLCVNAIDAMPHGGSLTLRTGNQVDRVEVQVEDTGEGMPEEVLAKAFEPFFTTKPVGKGTGLGLSLVYATVAAHQGQMEIKSVPGRGTVVTIKLPACAPAAQPEASPADLARPSKARSLKVLLIDDDELIQSAVQEILQALGHRVTVAPSGEASMELLEGGLHPDAIILDMNMPGLGGPGTFPRLRTLAPTVPVLLSTGRTDEATLDILSQHERVALLLKPFSLDELKEKLDGLG